MKRKLVTFGFKSKGFPLFEVLEKTSHPHCHLGQVVVEETRTEFFVSR